MGTQINRLTDRTVRSRTLKPGRHSDGGGLYLVVDKSGAKRWVFMSWRGGRQREIGLGGLASVPLARARELAATCREAMVMGQDPRDALRPKRTAITFGELATEVIASLEAGWRNDKHRQQWRNTLHMYAGPLLDKSVDDIDTEDVLAVLKPIWTTKAETASRVRGRIERILDAAKAKGLRCGENPARWRGHLNMLLPKRQELQRGHHPAMPWREVPQFVAELRNKTSTSALAFEFLILTAARSGEVLKSKRNGVVLGMRWDQVDFEATLWIVPADRMKGGREHRVPLADRALQILRTAEGLNSEYVFPGQDGRSPLSETALSALLRRMGRGRYTVHGFRSSFRDWTYDATSSSNEIAEAALAHVGGNKVERAYRRSDALERRRGLMNAWAQFVEDGEVIKRNYSPILHIE